MKKEFPYFTPYQFASNTPIADVDRDELEAEISVCKPGKGRVSHLKKRVFTVLEWQKQISNFALMTKDAVDFNLDHDDRTFKLGDSFTGELMVNFFDGGYVMNYLYESEENGTANKPIMLKTNF